MPAFPPIPDPLEAYAAQFDDLFSRASQRQAFRQYLAGLLLPAERNKTLTALANAEPVVGAQRPAAQRLAMVPQRVDLGCGGGHRAAAGVAAGRSGHRARMRAGCSSSTRPGTARTGTRRRTWGGSTWATGARSRTGWSRWAASGPTRACTTRSPSSPTRPQHWFALGKADPAFRTKPADRPGAGRPGAGAGLALPRGGGRLPLRRAPRLHRGLAGSAACRTSWR